MQVVQVQDFSDIRWFSDLAERVVRGISPARVLYVGRGANPVAAALRDRGAETLGIDIDGREYAGQAQPVVVERLLQALEDRYDLIVYVGLLERLSEADAEQVIKQTCLAAGDILLSSARDGDGDTVRGNMQPPEYWAGLFAEQHFFHDVDFDASFLAPSAGRFRKARDPLPRIVASYERRLAFLSDQVTALRAVAVDARESLKRYPLELRMDDGTSSAELYVDLLKKCLTRWIFLEAGKPVDLDTRSVGGDWPAEAETMIGMKRLDNVQYCVTEVIRRRVPGDLIETGVWRGGSTIFMRGILKAYGDTERSVWVADSFAGLPKPDPDLYPADAEDALWSCKELAIPIEEVQANFARYGLLDSQVCFLPGFFRDTLPTAPIERLAVLRLDGDMYESTMDALNALYPRLSVGGFVIVDDYGAVRGCKAAVDDFRATHRITEEMQQIDWTGVFWRREQ